jgi:hypothetical protein
MPILELPPNPARSAPSDPQAQDAGAPPPPVKVRTGRYGELEEHELIHLLDSLDDERSRARFRESVYISFIIYLAVIWFLFYGPRVLFHQPQYKDLISALKERDRQVTLNMPRAVAPRPPSHAMPDRKTIERLQQQPRNTPAAPSEAAPQPPPSQQAANTPTPPVAQPALPLPSAPRPENQSLPDAPPAHPNIAQNSNNPHDAMQNLLRGRPGTGGTDYNSAPGSAGPLQAGTTILSDTMGVDFSAYMRRLEHDIKRNWAPLIPEEVQAPLMKKGITGIRFSILPDGSIESPMILETPSGDVALDKAAWYAITSEGTYPRLPPEFHGPRLELRIGFYYNLEPPH